MCIPQDDIKVEKANPRRSGFSRDALALDHQGLKKKHRG
jgi:hypothetical protein